MIIPTTPHVPIWVQYFLQVLALYHKLLSIPLETGVSLSFEPVYKVLPYLVVYLTDAQSVRPFAEKDNLDTHTLKQFRFYIITSYISRSVDVSAIM